MVRISKRTVDAAPAGGKPSFIWDERVPGFGLLTLPSGIKTFVFQYRDLHGRSRRLTIGRHGDWTPDEARRKAEDLRQSVKQGADPLREKREARDALTVRELLERYIGSQPFKNKSEERQSIDRGRIAHHLIPLLGSKVANSLRPEDVAKAFRDITGGKTATRAKSNKPRGLAIVRGGESAARDCVKLLRAVLNWGISESLVKSNATTGVKVGQHRTRDTILEDRTDYQRLFAALDKMEAEKRLRAPAADAIRVLALSGARRNEIAGLKWRDVDLRRGEITLPPERHKAGKATGKPRTITLPSAAQAIFARQPAYEADAYVFPPTKGEGVLALSKLWRAVRKEAELPANLGLHGLRHSYGSHLAMDGASGPELMEALGHRQIGTTQRYLHFQQNARKALAERGAAVAVSGLNAAAGKPAAEVVKFKLGRQEK